MKRIAFGCALLLAILLLVLPAGADDDLRMREKLLVKIDPALLRELEQEPCGGAGNPG
jgi:hypothetical protein